MIFILIFTLLLLIPDGYIWWVFVRPAGTVANILWWLPAAIITCTAVAWLAGFYADWLMKLFFVILLCVATPKLVFMVFSLAGSGLGQWLPSVCVPLHWTGAVMAVAMSCCCIYGFTYGVRRLEIREAVVESPRLPEAFDGYRIVHISDLHVGTFGNDTSFLERLVASVNEQHADAVFFTGDLVNSSPEELLPDIEVLASLSARDGVWSVLGNHDYCTYAHYDTADGAARSCAKVVATERAMGWHILLNEHATVERDGAEIVIAGVENDGRPPYPSRGDLARAKRGVADTLFTVLLSHDPTHWRRKVLPSAAADVTFSGHTHAMQFEVFGFSPSSWSYPEWGGLYREGDRTLCVSKGAGGTAPFRLGAWPEITVVTLRRVE